MLEKKEIRKELRKRLKDASVSIIPALRMSPVAYFRLHSNNLWSLDKIQTTMFNQVRAALTNSNIQGHTLFSAIMALRRTENIGTEDEVEHNKKEIQKLIKTALSENLNLPIEDVEEKITESAKIEYENSIENQAFMIAEEELIKKLQPYLVTLPIYSGFMTQIRGLGVKTSAKLLSVLGDITRFPTPSSLSHYCGLHVEFRCQNKKCNKLFKKFQATCDACGGRVQGQSEKKIHGQRLSSNPKMKSLLLGVIADNFVKQNSQYRVLYDERKAKTLFTHPEWHNLNANGTKNTGKNMNPKHADKDAKRVMMKRFLCELWKAAYLSKGIQPPCNPWILNDPKHHFDPDIVSYKS